jgi:hypothetical protein
MAKREDFQEEPRAEMSTEEAKAFRAALYVAPAAKPLTDTQKREQFRVFWAKAKRQYGKPKSLEQILWLHIKSAKLDSPEQFEAGMKSFGLKKVK